METEIVKEVFIDGDALRADLIDYFGTAMFGASPLAMMELSRVENASGDELIRIAQSNGFDLNKYIR